MYLLWRLNVCAPTSYAEALNPQCDGISKQGLWEVIRFKGGHKGEAPMMVLVP